MAAVVNYEARVLDDTLAQSLATFPIVIIDGARGVGKTTTAKQLAVSVVEFPADLETVRVNGRRFLEQLEPPVLIDEWQLAGVDLLWDLKHLVDSDPTPGRFILTGSVEPATYGPTHPLTGRAVQHVLRPMTFREQTQAGRSPSALGQLLEGGEPAPARATPLDLAQLFATGFPLGRQLPDAAPYLEGYTALVTQRAGDEGRDATRLLRSLRVLAALESQAVPDQRIWEAADINKATWSGYDDLLTRTHITAPILAYSSNALKRLTAYPKRFFADTALSLALAGETRAALEPNLKATGRYFESYVMVQLRPQIDIRRGHLWHLRSAAGEREIDAIIELGNAIVGVEVKLSDHPRPNDAKHLIWLRDQQPERFRVGLVVHAGADTYELADQVWAVPVNTL